LRSYFTPPDAKRTTHYREAWWDEEAGELFVHHSQLGHIGTTEVETVRNQHEADTLLASFAEQNSADGYLDIAEFRQERLVISIRYKSPILTMVEETNAEKFAGQFTALLAWRGLGAGDKWQRLLNDGEFQFEVITDYRNKAAWFASESLHYTDCRAGRMHIGRI